MFLKFDENDLLNWKNNNSTSDSSGYMSFNPLFNFPSKLTSLNSSPMLFSSVFSQHKSEQHLNSAIVFSFLFLLSPNSTHLLIVDSLYTNSEFEKLLLYFAYRSPPFPLSSSFTLLLLTLQQTVSQT
jgi:hypothetical protein